ncbi:hypothetical protein IC762_21390 [Bradyrhizobium genosp. L]|uniref:hypothetical protein n=1 Tax=Bradyrhizobium genosp. L TaxID=83637 RepID=UPI0018A2FB5B|nr:hypothetical protein [Bradyrhizobium genosp. L]QPF82316.1 hypothetical protein IC762_21390 [Bradyrhizobium genosp. L]
MSSTCSRAFGSWLAGCGAATAAISSVGQTLLMFTSGGDVMRLLGGIVGGALASALIFVLTCLLTALPAAVAIWLSEEFQIRSAAFFALAGAAIGALSITVLVPSPVIWTSGVVSLFIVAGLVAGLTYRFVMRELAAAAHSM